VGSFEIEEKSRIFNGLLHAYTWTQLDAERIQHRSKQYQQVRQKYGKSGVIFGVLRPYKKEKRQCVESCRTKKECNGIR
jgi:hypothetical protein